MRENPNVILAIMALAEIQKEILYMMREAINLGVQPGMHLRIDEALQAADAARSAVEGLD